MNTICNGIGVNSFKCTCLEDIGGRFLGGICRRFCLSCILTKEESHQYVFIFKETIIWNTILDNLKQLFILWNIHNYIIIYSVTFNVKLHSFPKVFFPNISKCSHMTCYNLFSCYLYIISKLNSICFEFLDGKYCVFISILKGIFIYCHDTCIFLVQNCPFDLVNCMTEHFFHFILWKLFTWKMVRNKGQCI